MYKNGYTISNSLRFDDIVKMNRTNLCYELYL